jgi:hypothetical protein
MEPEAFFETRAGSTLKKGVSCDARRNSCPKGVS